VIGFAIPIACLVSTAALAQRSYDYRRHEDFANIKTFAFKDVVLTGRVSEKTTTYDTPFMTERIHAAVAAQLEARGMTRNDKDPDVLVSTARTFKTNYTVYNSFGGYPFLGYAGYPYSGWGYAGYPYGWGYGWGNWGWSPSYYVEEVIGTLAIDLEDAETGRLIWRGVGSKHVHESSKPERRIKRVNEEVADIFKNFPPPAGH
jgi:hypothetical protein